MLGVVLMSDCPNCESKLTYIKGMPSTRLEPPEPAELFCEMCDWQSTGPLDDYLILSDDHGGL